MNQGEDDSGGIAPPVTADPVAGTNDAGPKERRLRGVAASPGVAIGPAFGPPEPSAEVKPRSIAEGEVAAETARLDAAIVQSRRQLTKLRARLATLPESSQAEIAPLIDGYLRMLGPSRLVRGARKRIEVNLVAAESAVRDEAEAIAAAIMALPAGGDAAGQRRRAEEVREIGRRLIRNLVRVPFRSFAALPEGAVLAVESLRPADAALLPPARLAGVVTEEGGAEGHTAVMLRALGVPAVLGVSGLSQAVLPGDLLVVDGEAGTVVVNPGTATLAAARRGVTAYARSRQKLARLRRLPAVTADGEAVELQANMEIPAELPLIAQSGAQGIGLLRSEFLFMNRDGLPDETAQYEAYRSVVEAMGGDCVTVRVLDWSAEKDIDALPGEGLAAASAADNPALGVRGIRLLLQQPELFETQLAAILRAAAAGPVRVLLPLVTTVAEVRAAREVFERVVRRLRRRGEPLPDPLPPLGIMMETPAAALAADALALEVDFFAIGTNDLTMYALAVDRTESAVAHLYDPLHPAVLKLVQMATEAALRLRMGVSVCGEMAANPRLAPLLLGLGVRSFSMNASAVPLVKQAVRAARIDDCARLARRILEQTDPARIHELLLAPPPEGSGSG